MIQSLTTTELARYSGLQMNHWFPDGYPVETATILPLLKPVLERLETCFGGLLNRYFRTNGQARFDHLHSEQYAMFLYLLGNEAGKSGETPRRDLATKSYLLNKALHGLDIYFEIGLPQVFWLAHPVGTVLGRASYGNGFVAMQGCTVGNKGGNYPTFGKRVILCAGSSVIGGCRIGDDVCIGAGSLLVDVNVPDGSTVVGCGNDLRILPKRSPMLDSIFHSSLL